MDNKTYTIGDFANQTKLSIRTLRYYDSIDLLKPSSYTEGGHRLYNDDDLFRLHHIEALKFLGFPLKEIKEILEKNTLEAEVMMDSLLSRQEIFLEKQKKINQTLKNLTHLMEIFRHQKHIDISVFCSMLYTHLLEDDTKDWYQQHFSEDFTNDLFHLNKQEKLFLDQEWSKVLSSIKSLVIEDVPPTSLEAQTIVERLIALIDRTLKGNREEITDQLSTTNGLDFPNPFTTEEQQYLKEAMSAYHQTKDSI